MSRSFGAIFTLLLLSGCGGGGGNDDTYFQAGPYAGGTAFRSISGSCLDMARQCFDFQSSRIYITEQFSQDGSSKLVFERDLDSGVLAEAPPFSDLVSFSETLPPTGPCGFVGGDVTCEGTRQTTLRAGSIQDRTVDVDATLDLRCSSDAGNWQCVVGERGTLEPGF
jgi:hypothetical protein